MSVTNLDTLVNSSTATAAGTSSTATYTNKATVSNSEPVNPGSEPATINTYATPDKATSKIRRVNKATRKRKVLLEELASVIAKYGDVLANMSTNDIKQELRRVVNTQPTDEGSADAKVDS